MTTPVDPHQPAPAAPRPEPKMSNIDPTGQWQRIAGGNRATREDVKMFIQGQLKFFNVLIQQQQQAAQRANQRLKEIAEKGYSDE